MVAKSANAIMEYSKGGIDMSKAKAIAFLALIVGGIGGLLTAKADEIARDEMKAELKDEILNELNQERAS